MPPTRLALCLALAVTLAGCGSDGEAPSDQALTTSTTPADTTPPHTSAPTTPRPDADPGTSPAETTPNDTPLDPALDDTKDEPLKRAATIRGTARVVLSGNGGSHTYAVTCAKIAVAPLFSTANVELKATVGGSFDSYLVPRRDTDTFLYFVDDTAISDSIVGKTSTFTDPTQTPVGVQGAFGGKLFGGASNLIEQVKVTVSKDARHGSLDWQQTDGSDFKLTWRCG